MALCGILTAGIIVLSQLYCFHEACQQHDAAAKTAQQQENKKAETPQAYFTMPSGTAPAPASFEVSQETVFICDIPLHEEEDNSRPSLIFIFLDKFFQTLLRVIISPNAP